MKLLNWLLVYQEGCENDIDNLHNIIKDNCKKF